MINYNTIIPEMTQHPIHLWHWFDLRFAAETTWALTDMHVTECLLNIQKYL